MSLGCWDARHFINIGRADALADVRGGPTSAPRPPRHAGLQFPGPQAAARDFPISRRACSRIPFQDHRGVTLSPQEGWRPFQRPAGWDLTGTPTSPGPTVHLTLQVTQNWLEVGLSREGAWLSGQIAEAAGTSMALSHARCTDQRARTPTPERLLQRGRSPTPGGGGRLRKLLLGCPRPHFSVRSARGRAGQDTLSTAASASVPSRHGSRTRRLPSPLEDIPAL